MKIEDYNGPTPTEEEIAAAPIIEGWQIRFGGHGPQIWGWFFGHPTISDGHQGHSSPVEYMDAANSPAQWAKTESRLYRLGVYYPPAERDIREGVQKLNDHPLPLGHPIGGGDDVRKMVAHLKVVNGYRPSWVESACRKYREEKDTRAR
jgi:hypothetical protein